MTRRNFIQQVGAAAFVAATGTVQAELGVRDAEILLGQSVALSGLLGATGNEYRSGAQTWFEHVNSLGGVHGRQIKLVSLDDGYSVSRAVENTKLLIERDGVFAFFGQFGTGITRASLSSTIHQEIPLFAPYTGADSLREYGNPYMFHVRASYGQELQQMVDHLVTTGVRSIAVVYQDDSFGQAAMHGAVSALEGHKLKPLTIAPIRITPDIDASAAVASIGHKRPAAVIMGAAGQAAIAFLRRYHQTEFPTQIYALSEVNSRELASDVGNSSRSIVITQVVPSPWSKLKPVCMQYQALKTKSGSRATSYTSLEGFIAAKIFTEGLSRAGRLLSRDRLVSGLEGMVDYDAGGFRVNFGPGNRAGSSFVELSMLRTNGEFVR